MRGHRAVLGLMMLAAMLAPVGQARARDVVVTDASDITSLDPHKAVNSPSISLVNHIYDGLLVNTPDGIRPGLATRWEVSPDGKTYTFVLREGVKFHDGTAFDANAVKQSFDRVITPALKGTIGNNYLGMIKETVAVDPKTVRVVLDKPFGAFLAHIAHPSVGHIVSPAAVARYGWDGIATHPVGTGPFRFVEWVRSDHAVLERFDGYWAGKPAIDRIVYRPVGEAATRTAMVERGEAQLALNLPAEDLPRLSSNARLQMLPSTSVVGNHLFINTRHKPFGDVRVRRALNHAVDKNAIVGSIFRGSAVAMNSPIGGRVFAHRDLKGYPYDPQKARELLKEAGVAPGLKVTLEADRTWPKIAEVVAAVAEMLRQVGLEVNTRFVGDYAMYLQTRDKRDYDLTHFAWGPFSLDPDAVFFPLYHSSLVGKKFNFADYSRPEVDRLIDAARTSSNQEERRKLYGELQDLIMADAPAIYLYWPIANAAVGKELRGVVIDPRIMFWLHQARME